MPKYWAKNYFAHGKFPQSGSKAEDRERKRKREKEREKRLNDGNNNGQAAHASRLGQK